jgi:hypothetical protein
MFTVQYHCLPVCRRASERRFQRAHANKSSPGRAGPSAGLRGASRGLAVSPGGSTKRFASTGRRGSSRRPFLPPQRLLGRCLADEGVLVWGRMRGGEEEKSSLHACPWTRDPEITRGGITGVRSLRALHDLTAEYRADGRPHVESVEATVPGPIRSTRPDRVKCALRLPVGNSPTRRGQLGRKKDLRTPCRNETLAALHLQDP